MTFHAFLSKFSAQMKTSHMTNHIQHTIQQTILESCNITSKVKPAHKIAIKDKTITLERANFLSFHIWYEPLSAHLLHMQNTNKEP